MARKSFLMQTHEGTAELASTDFSEDKTGLANILQLFKDSIHLDVTAIDLVELTNRIYQRWQNTPTVKTFQKNFLKKRPKRNR